MNERVRMANPTVGCLELSLSSKSDQQIIIIRSMSIRSSLCHCQLSLPYSTKAIHSRSNLFASPAFETGSLTSMRLLWSYNTTWSRFNWYKEPNVQKYWVFFWNSFFHCPSYIQIWVPQFMRPIKLKKEPYYNIFHRKASRWPGTSFLMVGSNQVDKPSTFRTPNSPLRIYSSLKKWSLLGRQRRRH